MRIGQEESGPRVGLCWVKGGAQTFPGMLTDPGDGSNELVVPFEHGGDLERLLVGRGVTWGDDPDYSKHEYGIPESVWFADTNGIVCLFSPYSQTWRMGRNPNEARVRFRFAADGDDPSISVDRVHRLETRLEGLEEWYGKGSLHLNDDEEVGGTGRVLSLGLRAGDSTSFSRTLNGRVRPTFSYSVTTVPGKSQITDLVWISTRHSKSANLERHVALHESIRDLLVISGWKDYKLWGMRGMVLTPDIRSRGVMLSDWSNVRTPLASAKPRDLRHDFLFDFDELGGTGLRRWPTVAREFSRGIQQMISTVGASGISLETQLLDAGSGLEHLGHQVLRAAGESGDQGYRNYLRALTNQIRSDPGFDLSRWVGRASNVYRDVKHADRPDPSPSVMAEALRTMRLVFRFWLAERLGVRADILSRNLGMLPMRNSHDPDWLST